MIDEHYCFETIVGKAFVFRKGNKYTFQITFSGTDFELIEEEEFDTTGVVLTPEEIYALLVSKACNAIKNDLLTYKREV